MNRIIVTYWKEYGLKTNPMYADLIERFENNCVFDYSTEKVNEIIQIILGYELSVMIRPNMGENEDTLLIYIDKGRFTQS